MKNTPEFISDFEDWLMTFTNHARAPIRNEYQLETMLALSSLFDHPEKFCPTFHVTGSKGKGSLSAMLAAILTAKIEAEKPAAPATPRAATNAATNPATNAATNHAPAALSAMPPVTLNAAPSTARPAAQIGIYASPHVYDFRERVSTPQGFFRDEIYEKSIQELRTKIETLRRENPGEFNEKFKYLSWFNLVTIFAMLCFRNSGVSSAVYEVGMGGRLDATNIISPELCCIASIELEHTAYLGHTLEKIASEKAGIIKPDTPVVVAAQPEPVKNVFRAQANQKNAPIYFVDECACIEKIAFKNAAMEVKISSEFFARPIEAKMKLVGEAQARNAAEAALAMKISYPDLDESVVEKGLENATLPGRFEVRGNVILDGAHTPESIRETFETVKKLYPEKPVNLLFATGRTPDALVPLFKNRFEKIFLTRPGDIRKTTDLEHFEKVCRSEHVNVSTFDDYKLAAKSALSASKSADAILLVTGSFYFIDAVSRLL